MWDIKRVQHFSTLTTHIEDQKMTLFATKLEEINATLNGYQQEIDELEQRLNQLRDEKKDLENHAQQLSSAENAAESALEQVKTALTMLGAIAPSEIDTFKAAIDEAFGSSKQLPQLPEKTEEQPTEQDIIDVEAIENIKLSKEQLNKYTSKELTKIGIYIGISPETLGTKKGDKVAAILSHNGVTFDEVAKVLR